MLTPFVNIVLQQVPTQQWPNRTQLINLNFAAGYEIHDSWESFTNRCIIEFPKNILIQKGKFLFQQRGTFNVILGGSGYVGQGYNIDPRGNAVENAPLIMRGDVVYIQDGYFFRNQQLKSQQVGATVFSGYVSKIHSKIPIEIDCEDNFYLLKKIPVPVRVWKGNLVDLMNVMLEAVNEQFGNNAQYNSLPNGNPYPILTFYDKPDSLTANFSLGYLDIGDMTCSQLLSRLKSQYHLDSFFRGNVLHFGFPIYDEAEANSSHVFEFQNNIIDHNLDYKNKDDLELSTIVSCMTIKNTGKLTKYALQATKREKIKILVYYDVPTESFKYIIKQIGEPLPANEGGERHECVYPIDPSEPAPSIDTLVQYGVEQLKKYYYTGFRGSFISIGYPYVNSNDNVNLIDNIFADRNGQYKVKKVIRRSSVTQGIKQEIFLDFKQQVQLPSTFKQLYMI